MKTQLRLIIIAFFACSTFISKGQTTMPISLYGENGSSMYWTGTIAFSAINLTTTYFNIKKLHKHDKYRTNAIFGAISGAAQTALGISNVNAKYNNAYIPTSINIGIGMSTLVTSVIRLATKNPPKENNVSLNFIYLPDYKGNSSIAGLTFKKQF